MFYSYLQFLLKKRVVVHKSFFQINFYFILFLWFLYLRCAYSFIAFPILVVIVVYYDLSLIDFIFLSPLIYNWKLCKCLGNQLVYHPCRSYKLSLFLWSFIWIKIVPIFLCFLWVFCRERGMKTIHAITLLC